jgi:hypothetical protein
VIMAGSRLVMLFHLPIVVVDELFDVGLGERDLGADLVGSGGPGEGHGIGVPVGDTERVSFDVKELS